MKFKKFIVFILIIFINFDITGAFAAAAKKTVKKSSANNIDSMIKNQQKVKSDIDKKIKQYNETARQKAKESQNLLGQLTKLRRDANESQTQIDKLEQENKRLEASIKSLNRDIEIIGGDMAVLLERLRERVLSMYKYSSQENLHLLLSSQTAHEALTTAYNLGYLMHEDKKIVDDLLEKSEKLNRSRVDLEANIAQVQVKKGELKQKQNDFNATIKNTDTLLKDIQSQQKKAQAAAQELLNSQKEIGNRITALTRQKKLQQEKAAQAAKNKNNNNAAQNKTPAMPSRNLAASSLEWPVRGTISAPYGSRVHPVFKTKVFNSGIDIKAASGAPVKAAASGEVLYKGWIRGFGQVVILDHGGNISTVYAHLASASVREGDNIKTGGVLGTVGNSGADSEYGLHFEVRRGGSAQNPMNYLKKV